MGKTKQQSSDLSKWILNEISYLLGFEISDEIVRYILSNGNGEEVTEYLSNILDMSNPKSQKFIDELLRRWIPNSEEMLARQQQELHQKLTQQYSTTTTKEPKGVSNSRERLPLAPPNSEGPVSQSAGPSDGGSIRAGGGKKKLKFVPLYSQEGEQRCQIILPGRNTCQCQTLRHKLVNNCLECGRVVCEQEGSGPCFFCGSLVCSKEEEKVLNIKNARSEKLRRKLMRNSAPIDEDRGKLTEGSTLSNIAKLSLDESSADTKVMTGPSGDPGLLKAISEKERLLEFDKTCASRTKVIDDEADYYATDSRWLSQDDRDTLRQKEELARTKRFDVRRNKKYTLDFAGREVHEETDRSDMYAEDLHQNLIEEHRQVGRVSHPGNLWTDSRDDKDAVLTFTPTTESGRRDKVPPWSDIDGLRIQDRELKEMTDDGMCLSMHQPWASLLIAGIKLIEGRTWYTAHRGRLWIAATAKQPDSAEIHKIQHTYEVLRDNSYLKFPSQYPTGCLLGCVNVLDCLSREELKEIYTDDSESHSPYGIICQEPQELKVKFPVKGKPKIWKLLYHIHQAAKKELKSLVEIAKITPQ